jgi:hypothetical protein
MSVQVVINGKSGDSQAVSYIFYAPTEIEGAALIQDLDRPLLLFARELLEASAHLDLNLEKETLKGVMESGLARN